MIFSRRRKFLFVHVPRTGGTSMRQHLLNSFENEGKIYWQHTSLEYFQRKSKLDLSNYFKFAFVRNPWDRFASLCMLLQKHDGTNGHKSFEEILTTLIVDRHRAPKLGQHVTNQLELLVNRDGNVDIDFIGRFENFQQDSKEVLNRLYVYPRESFHLNTSLQAHYSTYYTPETIEMIAEYCRPDIDYFNYRFETVGQS